MSNVETPVEVASLENQATNITPGITTGMVEHVMAMTRWNQNLASAVNGALDYYGRFAVGPLSSRPTAATFKGFYQVDGGALTYSDGVQWREVAAAAIPASERVQVVNHGTAGPLADLIPSTGWTKVVNLAAEMTGWGSWTSWSHGQWCHVEFVNQSAQALTLPTTGLSVLPTQTPPTRTILPGGRWLFILRFQGQVPYLWDDIELASGAYPDPIMATTGVTSAANPSVTLPAEVPVGSRVVAFLTVPGPGKTPTVTYSALPTGAESLLDYPGSSYIPRQRILDLGVVASGEPGSKTYTFGVAETTEKILTIVAIPGAGNPSPANVGAPVVGYTALGGTYQLQANNAPNERSEMLVFASHESTGAYPVLDSYQSLTGNGGTQGKYTHRIFRKSVPQGSVPGPLVTCGGSGANHAGSSLIVPGP